ncbi:hypothetical protein KIN20_007585 [Parelaphostrongylus tenuis]|uniref:BPTI/Kunitz inhibitor domain-containing protein n=1 Tax=Parelaphostrongylus tenuis TaxID=148309 RepID=A0AAD5M6S9_PARTN|nr:hypothetical protein KIN20_007585 [Parelaphostrongylus tenuis]
MLDFDGNLKYEAPGSVNVNNILLHVFTLPTLPPEVLKNLTEPPKAFEATTTIPSTTAFVDPDRKQAEIDFFTRVSVGNMNKFVTKTQCIGECETSKVVDGKNPCRFGHPARHRQNRSLVICGPSDTSLCPQNLYCRRGENLETTVCCESSGCERINLI